MSSSLYGVAHKTSYSSKTWQSDTMFLPPSPSLAEANMTAALASSPDCRAPAPQPFLGKAGPLTGVTRCEAVCEMV